MTGGIQRRQPRAQPSRSNPSPPASQRTDDKPGTGTDDIDWPTRPYSSPRLRSVLLLCIAFRATLGLLGQKTFFQPDEFYQSLEPAHRMVWGTGYETWEWRESLVGAADGRAMERGSIIADLNPRDDPTYKDPESNVPENFKADWKARLRDHIVQSPTWSQILLGRRRGINTPSDSGTTPRRPLTGLLRSWIWPLLFALPYWALKMTGMDKVGTLLILAPRLPMVILAALTDFYTYRVAGRVLGSGYREAALFLSFTNIFHAHALTRTLTTSAETCLTVMALYYWPLPLPLRMERQRWVTVKSYKPSISPSRAENRERQGTPDISTTDSSLNDDLDEDNLALSLTLSAVAFVLRPTNIVLWSFLGSELCIRSWMASRSFSNILRLAGKAVVVGTIVVIGSVSVDFCVTGKLYFPFLTFLTYNIVFGISSFYGSSAWHYHLTQSIPILLSTTLPFFVPSFVSALRRTFKQDQQEYNARSTTLRNIRMGLLTKAVIFTLAIWSCINHKEWRFLHPLLPILLLYPTQYLVNHYQPLDGGLWVSWITCAHSFLRINRRPFLYLLLSPILPHLYLSTFHGRAQVEVTNWLREQVIKDPGMNVLFVMPCHSTPWMSHVHLTTASADNGWHFLTCEPPLSQTPADEKTEVDTFYQDYSSNLELLLQRTEKPTNVVLFESLHRAQDTDSDVFEMVYSNRWNGFDCLQDDARRKGGILVLRYHG